MKALVIHRYGTNDVVSLEDVPDPGTYAAEYGHYLSVADLFRQIAHDERMHKLDGLAKAADPRVR